MVRIGVRMVRDKREAWLAGGRMSERTTLRPTESMNDIECFLSALSAFTKLNPAEQQQLITDVERSRKSTKRIHSVRLLLAESIDGCEDEEIADAMRYGSGND
jgi:hypothetical protein